MAALQWIGEPISEGGVTERRFDLVRETGTCPRYPVDPSAAGRPVPLVLMGHGGSGHKRADRQLLLGGGLPGCADGSSGHRRAFARGPRARAARPSSVPGEDGGHGRRQSNRWHGR